MRDWHLTVKADDLALVFGQLGSEGLRTLIGLVMEIVSFADTLCGDLLSVRVRAVLVRSKHLGHARR